MSRLKCLFKDCSCTCYKKNKTTLCLQCKHHKIWHEKTKPPTDSYLQFYSPRKKARIPVYVSDKTFINIFIPEDIPEDIPIAEAIEIPNDCFCPCVEALPA